MYNVLTQIEHYTKDHEYRFAQFLVVVVLLVTLHGAVVKPLDHDEIFTFLVSTIGSPIEVYSAMKSGADNHPPVDHMLRSTMLQFGTGNVLLRLPTIAYFLGWLLCLYHIGKYLVGLGGGLMAMTLGVQSLVIGQSVNARMYGLGILILTLALWLWLSWETRASKVLAGLAFAVLFFLSPLVHYYLPFWMFAIAVAEIAWTLENRRVRWVLWAGMASILPGALAALPFALNARQYAKGFWTSLSFTEIWTTYGLIVYNYLPLLLSACLITMLLYDNLSKAEKPVSHLPFRIATIYLILLPFVIWLLSRITHAYSVKYTLGAALGGVFVLLLGAGTHETVSTSIRWD